MAVILALKMLKQAVLSAYINYTYVHRSNVLSKYSIREATPNIIYLLTHIHKNKALFKRVVNLYESSLRA